jgi:co-chaperonin GroES (HSP10)
VDLVSVRSLIRKTFQGDKMNFIPVNNYLYIRTVEDNETEDVGILLPQDYRSVESPHAVAELLQTHTTANNVMWARGIHLVVEAHMMKDIQYNGDTFTVVKENHVIGILSD